MEVDSGNPNLYHSIEDLKTDHLYDEIKHKGKKNFKLYFTTVCSHGTLF